MSTVVKLIAVLALTLGTAFAQGAPTLTQTFKPGDTLRYQVRFEGNVELTRLVLSFGLIGPGKKDQAGFSGGFTLSDFKPVSTGVFEVSGVIPKEVGTGTFILNQVAASHPPAARAYNQNELPKITVEVNNDAGYEFPQLKSITPTK